jgi:hypothetical protein
VRYCGITFSYTAVTVLLNYSQCFAKQGICIANEHGAVCNPQTMGLANGLAQSTVSLARFMGPVSSRKGLNERCDSLYALNVDIGWLCKLFTQSFNGLLRILFAKLWSFSTHADPEGYGFGFWFCGASCFLALLHSFTLN